MSTPPPAQRLRPREREPLTREERQARRRAAEAAEAAAAVQASEPDVQQAPDIPPPEAPALAPLILRHADPAPEPVPEPQADPLEDEDPPDDERPRPRRARARAMDVESAPRVVIRPVASRARPRARHWLLMVSFLLCVVLPGLAAASYLWLRTVDQFGSTVGFSIRSEEARSSNEILGQLAQLSGVSSADTDVLYQFIQSQELVERIDASLDLRGIYSRHYQTDPVFAFDPAGSIEDLVDYWARMIDIAYDPATGLMEITARAFDPVEAQKIAQAILDESIARINDLSVQARLDATRFASDELESSREQLTAAREAMTAFRMRNQIVDLTADIQGQMGLLNTLQVELANSLIELDLLRETTREGDPRIQTVERRIEVIRDRIADERSRFGADGQGPGGDSYAKLVAEFERLSVDMQFAEAAFTSARAGYDTALASAQRNSRYLAAHVKPTLAEEARYPDRPLLLGLTVLFAFLLWSTAALIYYSARDRR